MRGREEVRGEFGVCGKGESEGRRRRRRTREVTDLVGPRFFLYLR